MASPRLIKLAYGCFTTVSAFGFVEMVAHRMYGPPPESDTVVRTAACEIREEGGRSWMECARTPGEPLFTAPTAKTKPRVVVLGGSSVRDPFKSDPNDNFPEHLQARLPEAEVLNLGKAGMSMAGVAYIASQIAPLQADLVVIYEGHNDYSQTVFTGPIRGVHLWTLPVIRVLSESWVYRWLSQDLKSVGAAGHRVTSTPPAAAPEICRASGQGPAAMLATEDAGAITRRDAVTERFRNDLREAVRAAAGSAAGSATAAGKVAAGARSGAASPTAGLPVIVSTLLRNFDNPPMAEVAPAGSPCEAALACLSNASLTDHETLATYSATMCGEGALTWWHRAHAAFDRGDIAAATDAFHRSLALDPAPLRAPWEADQVVRDVASDEGATLLDLEAIVGPLPPGKLFHDTLHPSTEGAEVIATALEPVVRGKLGL